MLIWHQEIQITVKCHDSMICSLRNKRFGDLLCYRWNFKPCLEKHLFKQIKTICSKLMAIVVSTCVYNDCRFGVWCLIATGYSLLTYAWQTKGQGILRATNVAHILVCVCVWTVGFFLWTQHHVVISCNIYTLKSGAGIRKPTLDRINLMKKKQWSTTRAKTTVIPVCWNKKEMFDIVW